MIELDFERGVISEIAEELGVSRQAVHMVAHGRGRCRRIEENIAERCGMTPYEIWGPPKKRGRKRIHPLKTNIGEDLEWANSEIERLGSAIRKTRDVLQ